MFDKHGVSAGPNGKSPLDPTPPPDPFVAGAALARALGQIGVALWMISLDDKGSFRIISSPGDPFTGLGMLELAKASTLEKMAGGGKKRIISP